LFAAQISISRENGQFNSILYSTLVSTGVSGVKNTFRALLYTHLLILSNNKLKNNKPE